MIALASPDHSIPRGDDEPFTSPLFHEAMTRFDHSRRHVILEPGPVSPGILALLQGKRCRLLVADAAVALSELSGKSSESEALLQQVGPLINDSCNEKIDTVLCWDLLNYLSLPLIEAFTARLAALMSPAGMVHAYIHSAHTSMPRHPQRYSVLGEDRVACRSQDPSERKTPRYSYGDLDKHATGLQVARSMLLRNGIQEYLLRVQRPKTEQEGRL
ncbi:MAG: hypothetical protein G8D61_05235 [gamma proteobacterium symbiont of Ctena orbiculata]|nr:hypothetical protein [Candidatus Thiodiazotropha taylori]MBT3057582.1 hypothetical protein [Candidatus Thiodiazotropha sp. (ex Lucina pensylvanica)]MBT3064042.1 hypothetical protein [Candidatus Thiodiazotropha sp. (ex Lucina pensylvanica)]